MGQVVDLERHRRRRMRGLPRGRALAPRPQDPAPPAPESPSGADDAPAAGAPADETPPEPAE